MTTDPSLKNISNHPRDPASATPLPCPSAPKTYHRHHRWPPEPLQPLSAAPTASGAAQKPASILTQNNELAAVFSGSGPPSVFPRWGV